MGPSAEIAVEGRMEPTMTTGLSQVRVASRKNAVSSSVSVPCGKGVRSMRSKGRGKSKGTYVSDDDSIVGRVGRAQGLVGDLRQLEGDGVRKRLRADVGDLHEQRSGQRRVLAALKILMSWVGAPGFRRCSTRSRARERPERGWRFRRHQPAVETGDRAVSSWSARSGVVKRKNVYAQCTQSSRCWSSRIQRWYL